MSKVQVSKSLIVILLDESGSLRNKRDEIIKGFNTFIEAQREVKHDKARVILLKFNSQISMVYNCHDLETIPLLSFVNYDPNGNTALNDAINYGIQLTEKTRNIDESIMFVILTDGEENASMRTTKKQRNDMIKERDKKNGWNFIYIGTEPIEWGAETGMDVADCANFDVVDHERNFNTMSLGVSRKREEHVDFPLATKYDKKNDNVLFNPTIALNM